MRKKMPTILVADDDYSIRTVIQQALVRENYHVCLAADASELWEFVQKGEGDLVITDIAMPDMNGFDLLPKIKKIRPTLQVIVISALSVLSTALRAEQEGVFEYLPKPFDLKELIAIVRQALQQIVPYNSKTEVQNPEEMTSLVGKSVAMQSVYRMIARLTHLDLSVMITGESGTGKELVARALHDYGSRKKEPFVAINMASIPHDLIESELFGHEKGAFTGAISRHKGCFERAGNGTLFLDEIGDMPFEAQTRLLRVLQEGEFILVGGHQPIKTNARIIAATHRNLQHAVEQGTFRQDLYYRLNVVPIHLPPLRERKEDIPLLVNHFLKEGVQENSMLSSQAIEYLKAYHWPGNIRELQNLIARLKALYPQKILDKEIIERSLQINGDFDVSKETKKTASKTSLCEILEKHIEQYFSDNKGLPVSDLYMQIIAEVERPLLRLTLKETKGNQIKAATILGMNRNTLRKKLRELNIVDTHKKD